MDPVEGNRSRPHLAGFFVLACLFSWLNWGLVIASEKGLLPARFPVNPWGSFGPALAAVVIVLFEAGRPGLRALFRPLLQWRFGVGWWALVLFGPALLVVIAIGVHALAGGPLLPVGKVNWAELAVYAVVLLFLGGPLGEEIGWRGYALPGLLQRSGPVVASFVVAGMWAVWHLPLFWLPGSAQEGSSIPLFIALVAAFSILTTWVFLATRGSLLAAVLFHHSINLSTYFLPTVFPALAEARGFNRIFLVVTALAAAGAVVAMRRRGEP